MTTMGQREAPDQIVVATSQLGVVMQKLEAGDIGGRAVVEKDRSAALGLTLLDLSHEAVAARARLVGAENAKLAADALKGGTVAGGPSPDLTVVLKDLYERFRNDRQFGGWVPTVGSNRIVIGPAHNINGGGGGNPRPAAGALLQRDADLGSFVRIGVADTALYFQKLLDGSCVAPRSQRWNAKDDARVAVASGHGTFVAGLIVQEAPSATVIAEEILGPDGQADSWQVATSLLRFARSGIQVLNLSIECCTADNQPPLVLSTAIDRLGSGVQVIAAAGNHDLQRSDDDPRVPVWPAAFDDVLAVTARDEQNRVPDWSAPADLPWVDCVALGADAVSIYPPLSLGAIREGAADVDAEAGDALAAWSGTSFAAATVTGLIAAEISRGPGGEARAVTENLLRHAKTFIDGKPCLDT